VKKPIKRLSAAQEVLSQEQLPLVDVLRSSLFEAVVAAGSAEAIRMLEEQREAICGPRYRHMDERAAYRHGSCAGSLVMGGRRVTMSRPRLRSTEGKEVELPLWSRWSQEDPLEERAMKQMLLGVSTRRYAGSLEQLPMEVPVRGTSRSAVSRRFVAGTKKRLGDLMRRDLSNLDLLVLMIDGVHFEDQLASLKKCGHLGGKVLVPTSEFITKLVAARLAADVAGVDTVLIARTDALSATILANDIDEHDREFIIGERTPEGFIRVRPGIEQAISRALSYAPYADLLWFETGKPDMKEARDFAEAIHSKFPGKMLAYNCSPSFNWKAKLSDAEIASFQRDLGQMGYKYQFVTLSAFHSLNFAMFQLASGYRDRGMAAYSELQQQEFAAEKDGYEAVRHQEFVGTGYFDEITEIVTSGRSSSIAMKESTETEQFRGASAPAPSGGRPAPTAR